MQTTQPSASAPRRPRVVRLIVLTVVVTVAVLGITSAVLLNQQDVRQWVSKSLWQDRSLAEGAVHSYRSDALRERDDDLKRGELANAADINAKLAREAMRRALAVHRAWLKKMDKQTKLYAESSNRPTWNYRNTAADFFCFQLIGAMRLNPAGMDAMRATLTAEEKLRTPEGLCQPVNTETLSPVQTDHNELIFASSEYVKDGLLSVYERYGPGVVDQRMYAIVDALIAQSKHGSKFGPIPSTDNEPNGNLLQTCGRLSYATGREDYAEFGARIADAIIEQSLSPNNGLLPSDFDFEKNKVLVADLKLKDHGNEAVLGLSEMYALAVARSDQPVWKERAQRWAAPLATLFEIILKHGKNQDGLLCQIMQPSPPGPTLELPADNWGYILVGSMLYVEAAKRQGTMDAERIDAIEKEITAISTSVFNRPIMPWQGHMDSEADTVESAIYVAAYRPAMRSTALNWADQQIQMMYMHQRGNGTATNGYLDGNFIRTSLLYADARSGGWRAEPFRLDVRVGYAEDANGNAVLSVASEEPYQGTLVHDGPRHQTILKLPWDWPRLNSWPEWTLPSQLTVTKSEGADQAIAGSKIPAKLPISLTSSTPVRLSLRRE